MGPPLAQAAAAQVKARSILLAQASVAQDQGIGSESRKLLKLVK